MDEDPGERRVEYGWSLVLRQEASATVVWSRKRQTDSVTLWLHLPRKQLNKGRGFRGVTWEGHSNVREPSAPGESLNLGMS